MNNDAIMIGESSFVINDDALMIGNDAIMIGNDAIMIGESGMDDNGGKGKKGKTPKPVNV